MSESRDSKPLNSNGLNQVKTKESPNDVVMGRIFAQNQARENWLVRYRFTFGIGGLVAILGVAATIWALSRPDSQSLTGTPSVGESRPASAKEAVNHAKAPAEPAVGLNQRPSNQTQVGPAQDVAVAAPPIPPDRSLTPDEYVRLGMPAADREWSGEDMTRAKKILGELEKQSLPRYRSERSGKVFERMTSTQNLDIYRDRSLPLQPRLHQALEYLRSSGEVQKLYLSAFLERKVGDDELIEGLGAELHTVEVMLEVYDEFAPTLDKNEPSYTTRMKAIEKIKRGLAEVVAGCILALSERARYNHSGVARLICVMQETLPHIISSLPSSSRSETLFQIERLQEDPRFNDLQSPLRDLSIKLKAALKD